MSNAYTFDSSLLIESQRRRYPIELFPSLWDKFDSLIEAGRLLISDQVILEIERHNDTLQNWVKRRKAHFLAPADGEVQRIQSEIVNRYPKWVLTVRTSLWADPWVVAVAKRHDLVVVHEETRAGSSDHPKIGRVCDDFHVKHTTLLGLMRAEDWSV